MTNKRATIIKIAKIIEINRGNPSLSSTNKSGYITDAIINPTVNGKITPDVIFRTAPAIITQINTSKKKDARPK